MSYDEKLTSATDQATQVLTKTEAITYLNILLNFITLTPTETLMLVNEFINFHKSLILEEREKYTLSQALSNIITAISQDKESYNLETIAQHIQKRIDNLTEINSIFNEQRPCNIQRYPHPEEWLNFEKEAGIHLHLFSPFVEIDQIKHTQLEKKYPLYWFYREVYNTLLDENQKTIFKNFLDFFSAAWLVFDISHLAKTPDLQKQCDELIKSREETGRGPFSILPQIYSLLPNESKSYFEESFPFYAKWINYAVSVNLTDKEIFELDKLFTKNPLVSTDSEIEKTIAKKFSTFLTDPLKIEGLQNMGVIDSPSVRKRGRASFSLSTQSSSLTTLPKTRKKRTSDSSSSATSSNLVSSSQVEVIDEAIISASSQFKKIFPFASSYTNALQRSTENKFLQYCLFISPPEELGNADKIAFGNSVIDRIKNNFLNFSAKNIAIKEDDADFTHSNKNQWTHRDGKLIGYIIPHEYSVGTVALYGSIACVLADKCESFNNTSIHNNSPSITSEDSAFIRLPHLVSISSSSNSMNETILSSSSSTSFIDTPSHSTSCEPTHTEAILSFQFGSTPSMPNNSKTPSPEPSDLVVTVDRPSCQNDSSIPEKKSFKLLDQLRQLEAKRKEQAERKRQLAEKQKAEEERQLKLKQDKKAIKKQLQVAVLKLEEEAEREEQALASKEHAILQEAEKNTTLASSVAELKSMLDEIQGPKAGF